MEPNDKVLSTPSSCKDSASKCATKTLLTPCRSVGLKRKSSSSSLLKCTPSTDSPLLRKSTNSPIVQQSTDSPAVWRCTPNPSTSRKHLGSNIRDKLKKRKLDLSSKDNGDEETIDCMTKGVIETDVGCASSINSSNNTHKDDTSSQIDVKTAVEKFAVPPEISNDMILELIDNIRKKELKLRSLEETNIYAKKHNPDELRGLIIKWKQGCQDALREIQSLINEKGYSLSMAQVLDQFQVPHNMVNFSADCDEFQD
ncbi:uncharacterized protein LOC111043374 [Nilaparvata lugens]|uniref:uncharacterized protein LOC111043374 n=1 Tax=Nilaparvata lugens TaxID=108931 RepID=UPI00193E9A16|nr:uncharacterized protein LOC111043374 [Nilaparvata lugens]XP_039285029.1 uncharacterized protein LOC111043374 [Nilaparvata lugens]